MTEQCNKEPLALRRRRAKVQGGNKGSDFRLSTRSERHEEMLVSARHEEAAIVSPTHGHEEEISFCLKQNLNLCCVTESVFISVNIYMIYYYSGVLYPVYVLGLV